MMPPQTSALYGYQLFSLACLVGGIVAFVHFDVSQKNYAKKLKTVQSGAVQPETLTVVSKRASHDHSPGGLPSAQGWVVFHTSDQKELIYPARTDEKLYNSAKPGDTVVGYHFPDGYFIPQYDVDRNDGKAKWIFSVGLILMATLCFGISSAFKKRSRVAA